jgi:hypothetical protein
MPSPFHTPPPRRHHGSTDDHLWLAPHHIARPQGFDATNINFHEAPCPDGSLPEVWCYPGRASFRAGETLTLHLSSTVRRVQLRIVRDGGRPQLLHTAEVNPGWHRTPADHYARGCGWPVAYRWALPADLPSGFHHVECRIEAADGSVRQHDGGFVVRPSDDRSVRAGRLLLLAASCTWSAYNDWGGTSHYAGLHGPGGDAASPRLHQHRPWARGLLRFPAGAPRKTNAFVTRPGDMPRYPPIEFAFARGYSKYYSSAGWGAYEGPFLRWAESQGLALDVGTQADLHADGTMLDGYRALVVVGHDEYWSWEMRDHLDAWLERGGRLARFGGNFAFQVRLEQDGLVQVCHQFDGRADREVPQGEPFRRATAWEDPAVGRPGASTVGVNAFAGVYARVGGLSPNHAGGFTVWRPAHWAFEGTGLTYGDQLGAAARIFGYEVDGLDYRFERGLPVPTFRDGALPDTTILALSPAGNRESTLGARDALRFYGDDRDVFPATLAALRPAPASAPVRRDADARADDDASRGCGVIVHCRKGAGEIFTAASTEWVNGLIERDPVVERVTLNVLRRFGGGADVSSA